MDRDPYADMFRFRIGDTVRYAEYPAERHYIGQRRWTQREILDPVVEYRLRLGKTRGHMMGWIPDADLTPWVDGEEPEHDQART